MTEDLRPIRTPLQYAAAVREATARFPGDPDLAATWILENFAVDPVMAEALKIEGRRELRQQATRN